jgi:hypothetical protein
MDFSSVQPLRQRKIWERNVPCQPHQVDFRVALQEDRQFAFAFIIQPQPGLAQGPQFFVCRNECVHLSGETDAAYFVIGSNFKSGESFRACGHPTGRVSARLVTVTVSDDRSATLRSHVVGYIDEGSLGPRRTNVETYEQSQSPETSAIIPSALLPSILPRTTAGPPGRAL